ncbi:complement C1q-like protein 4 [Ostrea edulis]|uniref:complement C1q-like protein 4 n=1 Tax=Ostrea edulis TaxID=37623 RepID=UPI0020951261|nr:complement C1q-like protein 4 [Ostrea edulis]
MTMTILTAISRVMIFGIALVFGLTFIQSTPMVQSQPLSPGDGCGYDSNNDIVLLQDGVRKLKEENQALKQEIKQLRYNVGFQSKIAFTASVSTSPGVNHYRIDIIFPNIITNIGGAYNSKSGKFTAPSEGLYVFYTSVVSWDNGHISTDIVLNGKSQVRTMARSNGFDSSYPFTLYQTGTNLVCLSLRKADEVWVRKQSGHGYILNETPFHTFSGYKL